MQPGSGESLSLYDEDGTAQATVSTAGMEADRLVNAIPDARLVRLAGVARLVPEENPEHLSELLLDFIKRRAAA